MVNKPLLRPAISGGGYVGTWIGGAPVDQLSGVISRLPSTSAPGC